MTPQLKLTAVLIIIVLLIAGALYVPEEDDGKGGGGGPTGEADTPFDEEFGNVQVTITDQNTNEASLSINPNDPLNIVGGGNDYSTPYNDVWLGYYYSDDGGESWERDMIPGSPADPTIEINPIRGTFAAGDPVVRFGPDGECYVAGIAFWRSFLGRSIVFVARSDDGGRTFQGSNIRTIAEGDGALMFHDKEWMEVDQNNGNVYVTWSVFTGLSTAQIAFTKSTDRGSTWSDYTFLSETLNLEIGNQGSQIVVDRDSNIHVIWIDFDRGKMRYTRSTDEGESFETPIDIADVEPIPRVLPGNTFRTPTLPSMGVDNSDGPSNGTIYVTWNDYVSGDADCLMVISRDGGDTWGNVSRINQDEYVNGKDQFFPAVAISPEGVVGVAFYDERDDPDGRLLNMYMAMSYDNGETWTDFKISTEQFDGEGGGGSFIGQNTGGDAFIGDYIETAATEDHIYALWCDTRNGSPDDRNSDFYIARVII